MDEYVKRQLSSVPGHIGFYYKNLVTGETDIAAFQEIYDMVVTEAAKRSCSKRPA